MMKRQELNKIKRELFKGLEEKIRTISIKPETITFMRRMVFGKVKVYFEYNILDREINQIYILKSKNKKIIYEKKQEISKPQSLGLNKYFENKK